MVQRADLAGARPLLLIEALAPAAAAGDARQEAFDRLNQLALGKEFQAQVLSRLSDGSFLIKVDDAVANAKLPAGTQTGDVLELTLLATQPRPTFLLGKSDPGSASTSFSNLGRLIGNLLQLAQKDGAHPTSLIGKTALTESGDAPPAQIARALQHAINASGLFYESHVAQWVAGTRAFAELQQEPLAKRGSTPPGGNAPPSAETDAPEQALPSSTAANSGKLAANANAPDAGVGKASLPPGDDAGKVIDLAKSALPQTAEGHDAQAKKVDALSADAVRLISLQLDTLEQRRVVWQGELFPGQRMEWEVSDETPQRKPEEPASEPIWQSTVRFSLPTLGTVSATVRLAGEHVQVHVRTAEKDTATALRSHGALLSDALGAAGTTLDSLLVKHDG